MRNLIYLFAAIVSLNGNCSQQKGNQSGDTTHSSGNGIRYWITKADQSALLQEQPSTVRFGDSKNGFQTIIVDTAQHFQTIDGFGFSLTGGSAYHINRLPAAEKAKLLEELFGHAVNAIGISYLRISIGASDLNAAVFSYDDLPAGQTDVNLTHFSLSEDTVDLIPLLKQILAINPAIKILGSPWSAPVWMKSNGNSKGGSLLPQYYGVYANYFVKYIQAMKQHGITIDAITIQNEPLHPGNNPSMYMPATDQAVFVKNHLGPVFQKEGITTKIIIYDHNCNKPDYPITILNDPEAKKYIDGSAFHLYEGTIDALSAVHSLFPEKNLYFTEQWTGSKQAFNGNLKWHVKNVIIGSMRNWSKVALEWNLASDGAYTPHTPGGCSECKGALTMNGSIIRNEGYYIIAHASKFVPVGSVRIASNLTDNLQNVAFQTPDGKKVVIVLNEGDASVDFNIQQNGKTAVCSLPAGTVATYVW